MDKYILGKYVPYNTIIHRLDPRLKILALIMFTVCIFISFSSWSMTFAMLSINAIIIFTLLFISKVRFRDLLVQLKGIWFLMVILTIINIFIPPKDSVHIIAQIGGFKLYAESLLQSAKIILRLLEMFAIAMILTATTSPQELTFGFSFFMKPLKKIKFPAEEISMTISIALRFIPTLLEETNRIYKAQSSRGIDYKHGNLKAKIQGIIALIIPLFVSSFIMSDDLAFALEARGYNPRAIRTQYRILKWHIIDSIAFILIAGLMSMFLSMSILHFDFIKLIFNNVW